MTWVFLKSHSYSEVGWPRDCRQSWRLHVTWKKAVATQSGLHEPRDGARLLQQREQSGDAEPESRGPNAGLGAS